MFLYFAINIMKLSTSRVSEEDPRSQASLMSMEMSSEMQMTS